MHALIPAAFASALTASVASSHAAQSDSVPYDPASAVHLEAFHVVHDDGTGVQAFSAFTQEFRTIAPSGSVVLDTGDFCALVYDFPDLVLYGARQGSVRVLNAGAIGAQVAEVDDDVGLVVRTGNDTELIGYSGQTHSWSTLHVSGLPTVSRWLTRFAIAVRWQDGGGLYHLACFSARTGAWTEITSPTNFGPIRTDGNIVATTLPQPTGGWRAYAFSGVHGVGALSPLTDDPNSLSVSHNLAYVETEVGNGDWRAAVFSAYDGEWIESPIERPPTSAAEVLLRDNFAVVHDGPLEDTVQLEAIGARPHQAWAFLRLELALRTTSEDGCVFEELGEDRCHAFSGLGDGSFLQRDAQGPFQGLDTQLGTEGDHLNGVLDAEDRLHMFSPPNAAWAAPLTVPNLSVTAVGDAFVLVENGASPNSATYGYATRSNQWNSSGPRQVNTPVGDGSLPVYLTGGFVSPRCVFDTRLGEFATAGALHTTNLVSGRNLAIGVEQLSVYAYSLQRSTWELVRRGNGLPADAPLVVEPTADENVAWFVDENDELVAYGSPGGLHNYYQYPDGTEFLAFAEQGDAVSSTPSRSAVRSETNDWVWTYWAIQRLFAPFALPGTFTGSLWLLNPKYLAFRIATSGHLHQVVALPPSPPVNGQIWLQALIRRFSNNPTPWVVQDGAAPEPYWAF